MQSTETIDSKYRSHSFTIVDNIILFLFLQKLAHKTSGTNIYILNIQTLYFVQVAYNFSLLFCPTASSFSFSSSSFTPHTQLERGKVIGVGVLIREYGSTLYVGLARAVPPTNINFQPLLPPTQAGMPYINTHKHRMSYFKSTLTLTGPAKYWKCLSAAPTKQEILAILHHNKNNN